MRVALYYPITEGGVSRRVSEIQARSRHDVEIVRDINELEGFDLVHSYSDAYIGDVHTCATYLRQAQDFLSRRSKYFLKYLTKGVHELYQLKKFDFIISRSQAEETWLKKRGIDSHLVTAGVDHDTFKPSSTRKSDSVDDEKIVVFVGRLEEAKGVHLVLEASNYLPEEYGLYVLGDGNLRQSVKAHPRTEFCEKVPHEKMPYHLRKADVFCLPSYTECFPLSVLEAMACDIPVVATDVGDIKTIIQPPKGGNICSFDPIDIAEKILLSVENREAYTPRDLILKYTWESTVKKVEKIWETIIKD